MPESRADARSRLRAQRADELSEEIELVGEGAHAILGEESPLRQLGGRFAKSAEDALTQRAARWFENRGKRLWNSALGRVRGSGRTPTEPRVQAAIEITKHGAAEERPDLCEAYENLAARSMTEDEWEHDYEEYVQILSKLQSGDIAMLRSICEKTMPTTKDTREGNLRGMAMLDLVKSTDLKMTKAMGAVDSLEANGLLIVRVDGPQTEGEERQPGNWIVKENMGVHLGHFTVLPNPRGIALLEHIADLDTPNQPADA